MKTFFLLSRNPVKAMLIAALITVWFLPQSVSAQTLYKVSPGTDVTVKVLGTSNVHDWTMIGTAIDSKGIFKLSAEKGLIELTDLSFSIDVKSLKSEHSSMDSRTYKAIKADQYPKVFYKLISATVSPISKTKFLIKTKGDLTIAGVTQTITMDVDAVLLDNSIVCTGTQKIKLTDFKINPPSFMLGAMKVYDDLTIQFNLIYKK